VGTIAVGTSGWSYQHWDGTFYPEDVPKFRWFEHYLGQFPTVEVNYSFYRLPSAKTIRRWYDQVPDRFRYATKGSRLITHFRRLADCASELDTYLDRITGLKAHLGAILWQLPPDLERDVGRLESFLCLLPASVRHAMEFRHPSWLDDRTFEVLGEHGVACVSVSSQQMPRDFSMTADFAYARFHGLTSGFAHDYNEAELQPWADFLAKVAADDKDGFVYFNNDARARAPKNARELITMLGEAAVEWPTPSSSESGTGGDPGRERQ
jgi:uncharacterized protein YecE (DUF72 family)